MTDVRHGYHSTNVRPAVSRWLGLERGAHEAAAQALARRDRQEPEINWCGADPPERGEDVVETFEARDEVLHSIIEVRGLDPRPK